MFNVNVGISSSLVPDSQRLLAEARGYALMQEEGKAKQRYVEAIEKAKAELDKNHSIQGKKAFDELRTEHFNFLNKLKQAELAQEKGELVNYLFEKALLRLSSLEVPDKPSLFLVYAHENKAHGKAEAGTSKYLIEKLSQIQVVLYSDQTPIGQPYSSPLGEQKKDSKLEDILTNQLCLLPGQLRSDVKPVDKVVVCCSDVLGSYLKWREYDSFYQKLKEAYGKDREAYLEGDDQGNAWAIREVVREFSQGEKYKAGFHHVLTEMAFLQVRAEQLKDGHGIIPVPLTRNSYDDCLSRFISATTVRMGDIPRFEAQAQAGQEVYPNQSRHGVLFKLIERLLVGSDEAKTFLDKFWQGYSDCISGLKETSKLDGFEFVKRVDGIFDEIERALHKQLASAVQQVYPARQQVDKRLLDQSRDLTQIRTGLHSLTARLFGNLQKNMQKLRTNYLEGLQQDREIKDALANYVLLEGMPLHDSTRFDLEKKVRNFLISDKKALLLLGEAGSGKSTFNRQLAVNLWQEYIQTNAAKDSPIPVFIQLSSLPESNRNLVEAFFETQGFSKEQIKALQRKHRFVLILDGFDEIKDRQRNFYKDNYLDGWEDAKIIISSRPEYLGSNYQYKFHPSGKRSTLEEYRLAPFSEETIERYVDQYKKAHPEEPWSAEQYKETLKQPDLREIVGNPFLLKISLSVLPELSEKLRVEGQRFTRIALYDHFVERWFERSQERLAQIGLSEKEKEAFEVLHDEGFAEHGIDFSKDLALEMYHAGEVLVTYSPTGYSSRQRLNTGPEQDWHKRFLSNEDIQIKLKRLNAPVICQDKQNGLGKEYRFIHKSLQDYFVARALWEEADAHDEIELSSWLNTLNIVNDPAVLQFLAEYMQQERGLKERLLMVVEQSKGEDGTQFERCAANALTILVKSGVQLSGKNFNGIRVHGADLSYGVFDYTQFQDADLREVNVAGAWLRGANLNGADLAGLKLGERPTLKTINTVDACCYSPDGRWFAVASSCYIDLYSTETLKLVNKYSGHKDYVASIAFSPDGQWIVSGCWDNTVKLWSIPARKVVRTYTEHTRVVRRVAFSPDSKWFASGSWDNTVKLWSVSSEGSSEYTYLGHKDRVTCVAFSSDSQCLASGSWDNTVKLWNITGDRSREYISIQHKSDVTSVAFSPDGRWLATGSDQFLRLRPISDIRSLEYEYPKCVYFISDIAFSPNSQWLASGYGDGTVRLWPVLDERFRARTYVGHYSKVNSVAFSPDEKWLMSGSNDQTVRQWLAPNAEFLSQEYAGHEGIVWSVAFSPDGQWVASAGDDKMVNLWAISGARGLAHTYAGHEAMVNSVAFSPDSRWLASGSSDSTIKLWPVSGERSRARTYTSGGGYVTSVAFSHDGKWLAAGTDNGIRLWTTSGEKSPKRIYEGHKGCVGAIAFSPDNQWLVSGGGEADKYINGDDNTLKLWSISGAQSLVHTYIGHSSFVKSATFSPDGKWIASGSFDKKVKLWSVLDPQSPERTYTGHEGEVWSVAFSPDGQCLASGSSDCTVRLWSVENGTCQKILKDFGFSIYALAWRNSADRATVLATVESEGSVRIWRVPNDLDQIGPILLDWTSRPTTLTATGALIENAHNLSFQNAKLFRQRGAGRIEVGESAIASFSQDSGEISSEQEDSDEVSSEGEYSTNGHSDEEEPYVTTV